MQRKPTGSSESSFNQVRIWTQQPFQCSEKSPVSAALNRIANFHSKSPLKCISPSENVPSRSCSLAESGLTTLEWVSPPLIKKRPSRDASNKSIKYGLCDVNIN